MSSRPIPWHVTPSEAKAGIGTNPADHKSGIACGLDVRKSPEDIAVRCLRVCWHHSVATRAEEKRCTPYRLCQHIFRRPWMRFCDSLFMPPRYQKDILVTQYKA